MITIPKDVLDKIKRGECVLMADWCPSCVRHPVPLGTEPCGSCDQVWRIRGRDIHPPLFLSVNDVTVKPRNQADPYAELKAAYAAGKTIQVLDHLSGNWIDLTTKPLFSDQVERYRVKPEEPATPAANAVAQTEYVYLALVDTSYETVCQPDSVLEQVANSIAHSNLTSNLNAAINRLATACATGDDGPVTAQSVLERAAGHMSARAATYDEPGGERSMGKAVSAFNAITGRDLDESEGWLLLQQLKNVRLFTSPGYHNDSAEDAAAYTALMAEAKAAEAALDERLLMAAVNAREAGQ